MTGGMRMSGYDDGYNATPAELERAERAEAPCDDLEALTNGLKHLQQARAWLEYGGYCVPRIGDEIDAIKLAIRLLREREG